jgi:hypothetical protein
MDPTTLKTELATDPLHLGYAAAGGDAAIAALLNMPNAVFTANNPLVPLSALGIWAAKTGARAKVEANAANASSAVQAVCLTVRDLLTGLSGPPFDSSNADNLAMVDGLVAAGVLVDSGGNSLKPSLLALGNKTPASRAEVLFGPGTVVAPADVARVEGRSN